MGLGPNFFTIGWKCWPIFVIENIELDLPVSFQTLKIIYKSINNKLNDVSLFFFEENTR